MLKECKKHGLIEHKLRADGNIRCPKCAVDAVAKRRIVLRDKALEYKGGSCSKCGYNKCKWALEFHHLDPSQKEFSFGTKTTGAWSKIKNELDKCILVCANCHREIHEEMRL